MTDGDFKQFGEYTLLKKVASGGMAEIYHAQIRGIGGFRRDVAIKTVHQQHADDGGFINMLLDEARIAARLVHPNIAQVLNCGCIDGTYYIAMEFVDGHSLASVLQRLGERNEQLSLQECLFVSISLLRALGYAHKQKDDLGEPMGIVHRDVSPHNVMVSYSGGVKLVDFGVARAADKLYKTETGVIQGKIAYMAPEQLDGKPVDHRCDQFAAAVVTMELIANQRAYLAETSGELVKRVLMGQTRNLDEMLAGVPAKGKLVSILSRALSIDREARFPSCDVMATELGSVLNEVDPSFQEETLANRLRKVFAGEWTQSQEEIRTIIRRLDEEANLEEADAILVEPAATTKVELATAVKRSGNKKLLAVGTFIVAALLAVGGALGWWLTNTGSVRITTVPAGAELQVGERTLPQPSPTTAGDLPAGEEVEITATLVGHEPSSHSLRIERGDQTVNLVLDASPAKLTVVGAPAGADLAVGGKSVGKANTEGGLSVSVPAGVGVAITLRDQMGTEWQTMLDLKAGAGNRLEIPETAFRASSSAVRSGKKKKAKITVTGKGKLDIACLPWCKISIDGKDTGKNSPLRDHQLRAGAHVVEVVNPPSGLRDKKNVVIEAGGHERLRFRLQ